MQKHLDGFGHSCGKKLKAGTPTAVVCAALYTCEGIVEQQTVEEQTKYLIEVGSIHGHLTQEWSGPGLLPYILEDILSAAGLFLGQLIGS